MERRLFFQAAIYGLWSLIGLALALPASLYLLLPPRLRKGEEWVEAGDVSKLRLNEPEEMVYRRNRLDGWKLTSEKATAWVVRTADNEVVAFDPQCTHLGCAYHWEESKKHFVCPCHTSAFGMDGRVLSGPAPRALDRHSVKIEGGKVLLGAVTRGPDV